MNFSAVTAVASAPKVIKGDPVTITCSYQFDPAGTNPKITWTQNGIDFTATQNNLVTDGTASGNTGEKLYTVTTAAETDNGDYKCSGDYSGTTVESTTSTLAILSK